MDPLPTLDVLLTDATYGKDRLTRAVESAIAGAVAELAIIESFDKATATASAFDFNRPAAAAVRAMFEAWVATAEALEQRVQAAVVRAGKMAGADKLEHAVGRTLARLSITLDDVEQSARDEVEGRVVRFASMEEMRRELLRPDASRLGTGPVQTAEPVASRGGA